MKRLFEESADNPRNEDRIQKMWLRAVRGIKKKPKERRQ
jgi:hypothetical protein